MQQKPPNLNRPNRERNRNTVNVLLGLAIIYSLLTSSDKLLTAANPYRPGITAPFKSIINKQGELAKRLKQLEIQAGMAHPG